MAARSNLERLLVVEFSLLSCERFKAKKI